MLKPSHKVYVYPITVEPCEEGGFFADCAALQGCHAEGETYGEAIDNIGEVIALRLAAERKTKKLRAGVVLQNPKNIKLEFSLPVNV